MTAKTLFGFVVSLVFAMSSARAQTLEVLHEFQHSDGSWPQGVLIQANDGTLYGTTQYGGPGSTFGIGQGSVFKMTTNGVLTTLFFFDNGTNGRYPNAGLARGMDGNFYGTTYRTDPHSTIFRVTAADAFTTLARLDPTTNGYFVAAALIQARDGAFYGTARFGGTNNFGTVFRMETNRAVTTLVAFNGINGAEPWARLVQASDGHFYGTTSLGGTSNLGTVFRLTTNGGFTSLISFFGTNGARPYAGLVEGSDQRLYGTTSEGGLHSVGTVFRLTTNGTLTTLVTFNGTNGANPLGELMIGNDGSFYGTTSTGTGNGGTVFQLTTNGQLTTLATFNGTNGNSPRAGLMQGTDGSLYGAARFGGPTNAGTIFRVVLPQSASVSLTARRSGANLVLSWPTNADGFVLESTPDLSPPIGWNSFSNSPATIGTEFVVTNSAATGTQFFA